MGKLTDSFRSVFAGQRGTIVIGSAVLASGLLAAGLAVGEGDDSGNGSRTAASPQQSVRVVTTIDYYLS